MTTLFFRTFSLKDSLSEEEVLDFWDLLLHQIKPATENVPGVRSYHVFLGPGAHRANITVLIEMEDAATYERILSDPGVRKHLGTFYGAWDLKTATQAFLREASPEVVRGLAGKA
ncbi:MAG: hypothetical protein HY689_12275 [Chloroflexi bacterium]|nr:hypothetical protein [Chloroflexota bacterium]